jgi:hypothetical protein
MVFLAWARRITNESIAHVLLMHCARAVCGDQGWCSSLILLEAVESLGPYVAIMPLATPPLPFLVPQPLTVALALPLPAVHRKTSSTSSGFPLAWSSFLSLDAPDSSLQQLAELQPTQLAQDALELFLEQQDELRPNQLAQD